MKGFPSVRPPEVQENCDLQAARYGGGSPANPTQHIGTGYPGQRETLEVLKKNDSGGGAAEAAVTRGGGAQTKITPYGKNDKGPAWKDALMHFMDMADPEVPNVEYLHLVNARILHTSRYFSFHVYNSNSDCSVMFV